jgi:hypothetical protein
MLASWPPVCVDAPVPERLPVAAYRGPLVEAAADQVLLRVPTVGRYLAGQDGCLRVERVYGATDTDVACFAGGPVGAAALLLRGLPTIRGAAVAAGGSGVLICGPAAVGKSVLAAALAIRGHTVLSDRVVLCTGEPPELRPVDPRTQLWPDAAGLLGLPPETGRLVRPPLTRRAFHLGPPPGPAAAVPLRLIVLLCPGTVRALAVEEVSGPNTVAARFGLLLGREWHGRLVGPIGRAADRLRWLAALAGAARLVGVRGHRARPPAELAARVEDLLA